jgi:hypothetical protein
MIDALASDAISTSPGPVAWNDVNEVKKWRSTMKYLDLHGFTQKESTKIQNGVAFWRLYRS